jgi:hypothetical protein
MVSRGWTKGGGESEESMVGFNLSTGKSLPESRYSRTSGASGFPLILKNPGPVGKRTKWGFYDLGSG